MEKSKIKYVLVGVLFFVISCSSVFQKKKLSKDELEKLQIELLQKVRPILESDEFPYMNCEEIKKVHIDKNKDYDDTVWKSFGSLELRQLAVKNESNLMFLNHYSHGELKRYVAKLYKCEKLNDAYFVDDIGMCKASERKLFKVSYPSEEIRSVGEEVIKQKIRYYAIRNHYKTFGYRNIKYSFTRKEFTASAAFYKCY